LAIGHVDWGSEKFLTRLSDELAADELVSGSYRLAYHERFRRIVNRANVA
jgi:hypothetical protein